MHDEKKKTRRRSRVLAWLLAFNFVLFSSPLLPGWLALASEQPGTRLVELCTGNGLRLVEVPAEEAATAPQSEDGRSAGFDCAKCPLGKCSGSGSAPALTTDNTATASGIDAGIIITDRLADTGRLDLRPPTRAPPAAA